MSGSFESIMQPAQEELQKKIRANRQSQQLSEDQINYLNEIAKTQSEYKGLLGPLSNNAFAAQALGERSIIYNQQGADVTGLFNQFTTQYGNVRAREAAHDEYVKLRSKYPGRESTLLTSDLSRGTLLGG